MVLLYTPKAVRGPNCAFPHLPMPPSIPLTQVNRLEPLIEWEHAARTDLETLKAQSESDRALLALAVSERNALLRENDKIIGHYR